MSRNTTSFILGYHGCSEDVGRRAISGAGSLRPSDEEFDWLGPGVYFWESDPTRALEWAEEKVKRGSFKTPFVVGAVIDLGNCLDLLQRDNIELLSDAYDSFKSIQRKAGLQMPRNKDPSSINKGDKLLRFRDCAVIKHLHTMIDDEDLNPEGADRVLPFDSVRGLFVEGKKAYRGGGFYRKTHTQIAVRTPDCIKGFFIPREVMHSV